MERVNLKEYAEQAIAEAYRHGPPQSYSSTVCETCNGAMYLRVWVKRDECEKVADVLPCPQCQRPLGERLLQSGVRKSFTEWRTNEELNTAYEACHELLDGKRWCVFLRGTYGCGKTHLAQATAGAWIERGGSAVVVNVPDFLSELRNAIDDPESNIHKAREAYGKVGLLVLDDYGAEKRSEWTDEQLYQVIDKRYRGELPLVVTSNIDSDQRVDARAISRLRPHQVVIKGRDRRADFDQ